ncbi:MAG TPA: hypothetical protein VKC33_02280 [Burkholderiales bacterium]|nr:hypothetical protein [Burkholderiales bacterium]
MGIHRFLAGVAICAVSALAGCAGYTPSILPNEKPTGQEAYLYGRFYIEAPASRLALDGHQTMGFVIKCASGETYTLRFSTENALQVIRIAPSTCSLTEFIYTNSDGQVRSRKPAPEKLMRDARFDAGKAYYLGDFYAETTTSVIGRTISRNWNVKTVRNDYRNTSTALKAAYPNMSALPTEDRMIGK